MTAFERDQGEEARPRPVGATKLLLWAGVSAALLLTAIGGLVYLDNQGARSCVSDNLTAFWLTMIAFATGFLSLVASAVFAGTRAAANGNRTLGSLPFAAAMSVVAYLAVGGVVATLFDDPDVQSIGERLVAAFIWPLVLGIEMGMRCN